MDKIRQPRALLVSLGVYLTFFAVSVNPTERNVQATELHSEATLSLYLLGGLTHIGLGLDTLDDQGNPNGLRVWDFGSRNHYSYKNEEWISGKRNWLGSLTNLSLLLGTTEGEMRAWDPTKRFRMGLEQFKRSSRVKTRIPISTAQWQEINAWLLAQTRTFERSDRYELQGLQIWFGGGISYNLFAFNCATFIARALFAGDILTQANVPKAADQLKPIPSRWLLPTSLLAYYRTQPLFDTDMIERKLVLAYKQRSCLEQRRAPFDALTTLITPSCALS